MTGDAGAAGSARWPIGGPDDVAWIATGTAGVGRTVATAIPPVFDAYATVVVPEGDAAKTMADGALLEVLQHHTAPQPWWLGYLDTGASHVVVPDARRTMLYFEWPYVVLRAGPAEVTALRTNADATPWHSALPELIFPADRSWLVSTLWDDDWRCIGGPQALVSEIVAHPDLDSRAVTVDEVATPPGHQAL